MKEYETLKVYGKTLNEWKSTRINRWGEEEEYITQFEVAYTEYDFNGNVIRKGSEDFSAPRWRDTVGCYDIWTWDGKKYNAGGFRWFERVRTVKINKADRKKLGKVVRKWYADAAEIVDVRKIY